MNQTTLKFKLPPALYQWPPVNATNSELARTLFHVECTKQHKNWNNLQHSYRIGVYIAGGISLTNACWVS